MKTINKYNENLRAFPPMTLTELLLVNELFEFQKRRKIKPSLTGDRIRVLNVRSAFRCDVLICGLLGKTLSRSRSQILSKDTKEIRFFKRYNPWFITEKSDIQIILFFLTCKQEQSKHVTDTPVTWYLPTAWVNLTPHSLKHDLIRR